MLSGLFRLFVGAGVIHQNSFISRHDWSGLWWEKAGMVTLFVGVGGIGENSYGSRVSQNSFRSGPEWGWKKPQLFISTQVFISVSFWPWFVEVFRAPTSNSAAVPQTLIPSPPTHTLAMWVTAVLRINHQPNNICSCGVPLPLMDRLEGTQNIVHSNRWAPVSNYRPTVWPGWSV